MIICAVRDIKADGVMKPFAVESDASAEREFRQVASGASGVSVISQYPEDFELIRVGRFDRELDGGTLVNEPNRVIITGLQAAKLQAQKGKYDGKE